MATRDHTCPLDKVAFIGPVRGAQAKVRWLEGDDAGREDWVRTVQVLCPWGERRAVLKDERRQDDLLDAYKRDHDPVIEEAIDYVMVASGEGSFWRTWDGTPEKIERMWSRAKLKRPFRDEHLAYADRHGHWHLSYDTARRWAQAYAAQEPAAVALYLDHVEKEALATGFIPGRSWEHEYLRSTRPAIALARDWAGKGIHEHLLQQISLLSGIVSKAISYLDEKGHHPYARRLEREREGR